MANRQSLIPDQGVQATPSSPNMESKSSKNFGESKSMVDKVMLLKSSLCEDLSAAYGRAPHGVYSTDPQTSKQYLTDYEPMKLSSFRIFFISRGTIWKDSVLKSEQIIITCIFFSCATPVYLYFRQSTEFGNHDVKLSRFLSQQEDKMRAFAMIMTTLAAFLLSFYTSICVGRWWSMRTMGLGVLKASVVDLYMLLQQCASASNFVLSAVQRYGRASLLLIFLWRKKELDRMKQILGPEMYGILTDEECDLLANSHCRHETIWAWQTAIVTKLKDQGNIQSQELFMMLLQKCTEGRGAVQCIHTHLAVKIPMQYVHLLGLLVKMHNLVLSIIMGLLFGAALRRGHAILCIQLFARTLILPFLFNAILLINCDLADPFNGEESDFPGEIYQANLGKDCEGIGALATSFDDVSLKKGP